MIEIFAALSTAIIEGNIDDMVNLTENALNENFNPQVILDKGVMPGMDHVGVEFKSGNMFIPKVLRSARAIHKSMDLLRPLLAETGAKITGKVILGTVKGDLHDIGKNLVCIAYDQHAFDGTNSLSSGRSRFTRQDKNHDWRRSGHTAFRRPNRRGWLCIQRGFSG